MGGLTRRGRAGILAALLAIVLMALITPVFGANKTAAEYITEGQEFLKANKIEDALPISPPP